MFQIHAIISAKVDMRFSLLTRNYTSGLSSSADETFGTPPTTPYAVAPLANPKSGAVAPAPPNDDGVESVSAPSVPLVLLLPANEAQYVLGFAFSLSLSHSYRKLVSMAGVSRR